MVAIAQPRPSYSKMYADMSKSVSYIPTFARLTGSVTAAVLLQQIVFRWEKNSCRPFYKFRIPCEHELYRSGDSWCEELAFTSTEFDTALSRIGTKITQRVSRASVYNYAMPNEADFDSVKPEHEKAYADALVRAVRHIVTYWTDGTRVTYYDVNTAMFDAFTELLYKGANSGFLNYIDKSRNLNYLSNCGKPNYIYTDITQRSHKESNTSLQHANAVAATNNPKSDPISESETPTVGNADPVNSTVQGKALEEKKESSAKERKEVPNLRLVGSFNPDMLQLALDVRGYEISRLALLTRIPISLIEDFLAWKVTPTKDEIELFGEALSFPMGFFYQEGEIKPPDFACLVDDSGAQHTKPDLSERRSESGTPPDEVRQSFDNLDKQLDTLHNDDPQFWSKLQDITEQKHQIREQNNIHHCSNVACKSFGEIEIGGKWYCLDHQPSIRALTVKREYAERIGTGEKPCEIRNFKTDYRGQLVLTISGEQIAYCVVDLVDIVLSRDTRYDIPTDERAYGKYAWILSTPRYLEPVSVKGKQGLWTWEGELPPIVTEPPKRSAAGRGAAAKDETKPTRETQPHIKPIEAWINTIGKDTMPPDVTIGSLSSLSKRIYKGGVSPEEMACAGSLVKAWLDKYDGKIVLTWDVGEVTIMSRQAVMLCRQHINAKDIQAYIDDLRTQDFWKSKPVMFEHISKFVGIWKNDHPTKESEPTMKPCEACEGRGATFEGNDAIPCQICGGKGMVAV